jgi:hypothetical protein
MAGWGAFYMVTVGTVPRMQRDIAVFDRWRKDWLILQKNCVNTINPRGEPFAIKYRMFVISCRNNVDRTLLPTPKRHFIHPRRINTFIQVISQPHL